MTNHKKLGQFTLHLWMLNLVIALANLATLAVLPAQEQAVPNSDSQAQAAIRQIVTSGTHPGIRWTRFPYYRDELEKIYGPRGYGCFWINDAILSPRADEVVVELSKAADNGLDPRDYDAEMLAAKVAQFREGVLKGEEDVALLDAALTIGLLRYISDLHIGRINPKNLHFGLNVEGKKYDLALVLEEILKSGAVRTVIEQAQPGIPLYNELKAALPKYRALAHDPRLRPIPAVEPVLKPGEHYRSIAELAHLLVAVGDLSPETASRGDFVNRPTLYNKVLVDAVKRYQVRHGLTPDGVLGPASFAALNVPMPERLRSIEMALERLRWLPSLGDEPFIVVNIPGFRLQAFESGDLTTPAFVTNVIVGSAINKTETPIFSERMTYLDFSPYWNVPANIARGEMLARVRSNPGYLQSQDLELVSAFGNDEPALRVTPEAIEGIASGKTLIRQRPGPKNALGLVKFIFPNAHNVYLHSTPQQELFADTRRDFSHGCIRVEHPRELAAWVLRDQPRWSWEKIEAAMDGKKPERVTLKKPLPVYIFYTTVVIRDGAVCFFPDIYKHDQKLERALAKGYPYDP